MDSVDSARNLVEHYADSPATIRSKTVYFQYSNRSEVKAPSIASQSSAYGGSAVSADPPPNNIVIVSILNARVPVTIENIHQIFKPYGEVLKIVTFVKDNVFKALVQMSSVESAINAKINLEGKDMFQGCCHLRIGFSKLKDLEVKANGPRMRDFTKPDYSGFNPSPYPGQPQFIFPPPATGFPGLGFDPAMGGGAYGGFGDQKGCVLLVNNLSPDKITPDKLFILFGVYGDVLRVKILYNKRDTALIQFATPQQAQTAQLHLNHLQLYDKELGVSISKHVEISMPRGDSEGEAAKLTKDFSGSPIHRFKNGRNVKNINAPSQVLHVSSLSESCSEDQLRKLFGQYQSSHPVVQFFKNNRQMAYIKMDSLQNALEALMNLHNYKLGDRYIRVSFSTKSPGDIMDSDSGAE